MRERKKKHMAKGIIRGGGGKTPRCFPFKFMRLFLGFIIRTHQTSAFKQKSCNTCSGLAPLPVKGTVMPHGLCCDTEG